MWTSEVVHYLSQAFRRLYSRDCKAVTIYLFYVTDPWENLIIVDTILPPPLTQIYNNINICKQLQESSK